MPAVENTIKAALLADAAVAALVGTRVYAGRIPPNNSPTPWVYFTVPEENPGEELASNGTDRWEIELELFAEDYQAVRALKGAVRAALNGFRGGYCRRCLWQSGTHVPLEDGHNWTERYLVLVSPIDLGAMVVTWGPVYLVWGP